MRRRLPLALALGLAAALLFSSLATSGLGEPFELDAADRARRFAVEVLGARRLAIEGGVAPAAAPPEVASGPLPAAAVALGFAIFGPHVWAGRLLLALMAFGAVLATAFLLARLVDERAAAYGAAALSTMPLFFVQARTMLGDAASMAADAAAFAGLGVAVFDRRGPSAARSTRVASLALGVAGLAAGALSRGALLGVAVPALGVGVAWAMLRRGERDALADGTGAVALVVGLGAAASSVRATPHGASHPYFDAVFQRLGHALFPWSGVALLAFVALLAPPSRASGLGTRREEAARALVLAGSVVAFAAHALGVEVRDAVPFTAPALLSAGIAIAARDLDRRAAGEAAAAAGLRDRTAARVATVMAALLVLLLGHDLSGKPSRALASILPMRAGAVVAADPRAVRAVTAVVAAALALSGFGDAPAEQARERYLAWPRTLFRVWDGHLGTALTMVEAALVSIALVLVVRPASAAGMGELARLAARHAWWAFPVAVLAVAWLPACASEVAHAARRCVRVGRGAALVLVVTLGGASLAWGYYPSLLGQVSAGEALARYRSLHAPGEPLGALGVDARAASFEAGAVARPLADAWAADRFLASPPPAGRSFVVVRRDGLAALNAVVRAREGHNAFVVAGGESGALLVASARRAGDPLARGPLDDVVLDGPPPLAHAVEATVGDALVALGWDIRDASGVDRGDTVVPLSAYRLRLYYRVTGKLEGNLCTFVRVDGEGRRFNAEHRDFPRYPLRYWKRGDVLVDEFEIALGGNFTPGAYALRYGFDRPPCDGRARLRVDHGPHDASDRIVGGTLHVR